MKTKLKSLGLLFLCVILVTGKIFGQRQMENLDRGLVAIKVSSGVFLSWRLLGTEWSATSYNIYRNGTLVNSSPITGATNYTDASGTTSSTYYIKSVVSGVENATSSTVSVWSSNYLDVPLSIPSGLTMPDASTCTYSPNDCSVGDVDGDGQYEIIVKWDPSNSKDNSVSGYTGNVYLDAYKLSGTKLWRIDLGVNIRAGAHYTQFLVYDFDGDGKAEIVCKTAPGTIAGNGSYLSTGPAASDDDTKDYRSSKGYILSGPEYLTVFKGSDGSELLTIDYEVGRGTVSSWGDSYGNRVDRFLACVAYLNGKTPSIVMCRGYYTRCYLVAYTWNGSAFTKQWAFDSSTSGNSGYKGQGCHSLCVGDVDDDGYDEIVFGACTIDHDGTGLYTTGLGHGDALHLGDFDPNRSGLEVWQVHEDPSSNGGIAGSFRQAEDGDVIWEYDNSDDEGRGMAADIDSTSAGAECWGISSGLFSSTGTTLSSSRPATVNFGIWWDGDDLRELLDGTAIKKYGSTTTTLLSASSCSSNNSTKSTPCLSADIFGDWREEVIWRTSDNAYLRIYTTTSTTSRRLYTLMHDPMYRLGIAWQNVAYNQPPDPSFFLGHGMSTPPTPNIYYAGTTGTATLTKHGSGSSSQTVTLGSAITSFYYSWTVASTVTVTGLPAGLTATINTSAQTVTISGTPTVAGTYKYTITTAGASTNVSVSGKITVSPGTYMLTIQEGCVGLCSYDGTIDSDQTGFVGSGYINTTNTTGAGINYYITFPSTGSYTFKFMYAANSARPADLLIGGTTVISAIPFASTTAWTNWTLTTAGTVSVTAGTYVVRLQATTSSGTGNIDYMTVTGASAMPVAATCTSTSSALVAEGAETSDVTEVQNIENKIRLYPNPVKSVVSLVGTLKESVEVNAGIYNQLGVLIESKQFGKLDAGSININMLADGLSAGIYFLKVKMGSDVKFIRFIKL